MNMEIGAGQGDRKTASMRSPDPGFTDSFRVHRPLKPLRRSFRGSQLKTPWKQRPREERACSRSHREQGRSPHPHRSPLCSITRTRHLASTWMLLLTVSSSLPRAVVLTGGQLQSLASWSLS